MPFVTGMSGLIYLVAALVLNAMFIFYALQMKLTERAHLPMKLFRFSITYLMWLFAALLAATTCPPHRKSCSRASYSADAACCANETQRPDESFLALNENFALPVNDILVVGAVR